MSTYRGWRHNLFAVSVQNSCFQQVSHLSQSISEARKLEILSAKNKKNTIKIGKKKYTLYLKDILNDTGDSCCRNAVLSNEEMALLEALPNMTMFNSEKAFLAPTDKISKMEFQYAPDSTNVVITAKEMLSLQERSKVKKNVESRTDVLQQTQDLNSLIREYLQNGNDTLTVTSPGLDGYWKSLKSVLNDLTNAQCFDDEAAHPTLRYSQRFQCIANHKGIPSIITINIISNRNQQKLLKLELVACAAAFNFDPRWPVQVKNLVLILPKCDGSPAIVHTYSQENISVLWQECLIRIEKFWRNPNKSLLLEEKMRTPIIPSVQNQDRSVEPKSITNKKAAKTVFVPNCEEIMGGYKKRGNTNSNTSDNCSYSSDAKPEIKEDTPGENHQESAHQSIMQPEIDRAQDDILSSGERSNKTAANPQHINASPKPTETVLGSLWNFLKSK